MNLRTLSLIIVLVGAYYTSADASPIYFEIIGDPAVPHISDWTVVTGDITGEITGLPDNGYVEPTDILITSIPSGLGITASPSSPYSFAANGWTFEPIEISDGMIQDTDQYGKSLNDETTLNNSYLIFRLDPVGSPDENYFAIYYDSTVSPLTAILGNALGASGVIFSSTPIPEPSQYGFFIVLTGAGLIGWRRLHPKAVA